jgi:Xaa-Pro aminopeptidase
MIYVIAEADDLSIVKLGFTESGTYANRKAALSRMSSMQVGTWRELVLVAICAGTMDEEQALHSRFRDYWVRGEWFKNEGPVAEWVASITTNGIERTPAQRPPPKQVCAGCDVLRKTVREMHSKHKDAVHERDQALRALEQEAFIARTACEQTHREIDALAKQQARDASKYALEVTKMQKALHTTSRALEQAYKDEREQKQAAAKLLRETKQKARLAARLKRRPSNCVLPRICECSRCRQERMAFDPFKRASSGLLVGNG